MSERDDFLASVLPSQLEADTALHAGDASRRKELWSHGDPVTVFGAAKTVSGWAEVEEIFDWLGRAFTGCESYDLEVVSAGASGDLGFIVGHERTKASVGDAPVQAYELRVTLLFRREAGRWKAFHRHADPWPGSQGAVEQINRIR